MYRLRESFGIVLALWLLASRAVAQGPRMDRIVLTDQEAFGLLPAELVAAPTVREAKWSPDGRYALLVRETMRITPEMLREAAQPPPSVRKPPPGEISLVLWNSRERRADVVWKAPFGMGNVEQFHWLPGSGVALASVSRMTPQKPASPVAPGTAPQELQFVHERALLRIDGATGKARALAKADDADFGMLHVSPTQSLALLQRMEFPSERVAQPDGTKKETVRPMSTLLLLRADGTLSPPVRLPEGTFFVRWSNDGRLAYLMRQERAADAKSVHWHALDPRTGRITPLPKEPSTSAPKPSAAHSIHLRSGMVTAKEGETTQQVSLLWLESVAKTERPRALVSADIQWAELSPRGDAALYISQGAAWMVPLVRLSREEYEAMRRAALKARAISNAKQVALGIMMHAQDHDEVLPPPDGLTEKILPYVKNASLFEGLVYIYPGGPLSGIEKPAETELGYVTGPGGRAIFYADGHVKWRDD